MTQPLDRQCVHPALGEVDEAAGEFWVGNPFLIPSLGANLSAYETNRVFLNLEGQSFLDASFASAADIDADSRSVIDADFDRDGRPDLLVGSVGGGPLRLFLNRMPQGKRVEIELVGVASNRAGIGCRLVAEVHGRRIVRDVFPANGCMGIGPAWVSLGIGDADAIDLLEVRWPSGTTGQFSGLKAGSRVTIREGDSEPRRQ